MYCCLSALNVILSVCVSAFVCPSGSLCCLQLNLSICNTICITRHDRHLRDLSYMPVLSVPHAVHLCASMEQSIYECLSVMLGT